MIPIPSLSKSGLELVRELDVVNDNPVVGRFIDERADVWLPQGESMAKRSSELIVADDVAGRWMMAAA